MMKTLKKLFERSRARAYGVGSGGIAVFLVLALAALAPQGARGYGVMENDRILLMNNDSKRRASIKNQGYYDTDPAKGTYWVHEGDAAPRRPPVARALLDGTTHVMYEVKEGGGTNRLWELQNCRAGSATVIDSTRNYIPWESTAKSILDETIVPDPMDSEEVKGVGTIILRNTNENCCVYSPVYTEGIGTIYFDAVNAFTDNADIHLEIQIATNALNGVDFLTASNSNANINWQGIPFTVFKVTGAESLTESGTLTLSEVAATNLVLASTEGGAALFYRVRAHLNYYGPIRFRIRRTDMVDGRSIDTAALALVDNLIASYPPMTAVLNRYGKDYDKSLKGAEVLGCLGDFDVPLLSHAETTVRPRARFHFVTNSGSDVAAKIKDASLVYRWRYLNQVVTPWRTVPFDQDDISSDSFATSNLVGTASLQLGQGVGDLEYYMTAKIDAQYYAVRDYALGSIGYGADWTEQITAITNRANYVDETPAGGHDYFVRIRESVSPFEYVKLCTSVTTNGTGNFKQEEPVRMELVSTNTWRYCYYVPTNMVGETLAFHFEGRKLFANPSNAFEYVSSDHVWKCDLETVPYLPYTSVAGAGFARDVKVKLDNAATHLIIEFNDDLLSYSVSHGTYQNFNAWTDALVGYRGNAMYNEDFPTNGTTATGVSDTKKKFTANMADWEIQGYSNPFWTENFNTSDTVTFPLYTSFDTSITPLNGWEAGHGQWIRGARGTAAQAAAQEEVSLQMEGRGQGYVALDKESGMPKGIGTVTFAARIAQAPRFDDFAVYGDGSTLTDYAVSAKITMSRIATKDLNPGDISPSQPSVSLIGRYREKKGAYEFRISRTASDQLTCALYKWLPVSGSGMTAHLLTSNVITSAGSGYAKPDLRPGATQTAFSSFQNMLVPYDRENVDAAWTSAYLFMFTKGDGSVYIKCALSNSRNNNDLATDKNNLKDVLIYEESSENSPFLKGSYGVASTDCHAAFGAIKYHKPADEGDYSAGIDYAGTMESTDISGDWAYYQDRWYQPQSGKDPMVFGSGSLYTVMPSNQTVRLQFKDDARGWFDSGYEQVITSFSTNFYTISPSVSPDYKVRLITGGHTYDEVRTDVVVDDIEITSWRAANYPGLDSTGSNAQSGQWVYMAATLEASALVKGPGTPSVSAAGTNGYAFAFSTPGQYTFVPQMDLVVDRMLLVGGGGAGGWTLGGGGGGGGVLEYDYGTNAVLLAKGSTNIVIVGGGGDNYFVNSNGSGNWKSGGNGGQSRIVFKDANANKSYDYTVKGGGGGGGWGKSIPTGQATGGGEAQGANNGYDSGRTAGTANQGNSGGRAYGDRAGGGGGASLEADGMGQDGTADKDGAGDGGAGRASDITGEIVYYGGGGGGGAGTGGDRSPDSAVGGKGGVGGGGTGLDAAAQSRPANLDGENGLGGGGGGGSNGGKTGTNAGGKGGSGTVILRLRSSSKVCTLQPARGSTKFATGLRSPYLGEGLSMFSFNYANANSNCVLWLQVCTNNVINGASSMSSQITTAPPEDMRWNTVASFAFTNVTGSSQFATNGVTYYSTSELKSGTCTHFMSLRAPYRGFMRLVVAPEVMQFTATYEGPDRDVAHGQITVTGIYCYNEPPLDMRSWWGWNFHTEGWNTDDKQYAYLFDSPEGLSGSLNFSALDVDNDPKRPDTRGIGLTQPDLWQEYKANNSFVQCPPLTNGIGTVTFRARTFTTNQTKRSQITLFGSSEPDSDQVQVPGDWKQLKVFDITNETYQTFKWSTTDDSTKYYAVRLEVTGTRHGRSPGATVVQEWEKPLPPTPIQRVWIDEITASEPIAPRIVFRDVRPFRSQLGETVDPKPVTNVTDLSEQPILGESWGLQATVEPQQMSDELVTTSVVVYAAFYRGISPWGYTAWSNRATAVKLEQVSSNLVFRSTYNNAASVIGPDMTPNGIFPNSVWQYYVWAEYLDKQGVKHIHGLDSSEWSPPSWYYGIKNFNETYGAGIGEKFAGYTILDSISPQRAWLNEVNICDVGDTPDYENQFIEIAVPQGADLTDWRIDVVDSNVRRGSIASFGFGNAPVAKKIGTEPGVDNVNHYTFMSLCSPTAAAKNESLKKATDGIWNKTASDTNANAVTGLAFYDGQLRYYQPYGVSLVRPSGIIEHQIVVQPTNLFAGLSGEATYSGTNLLAKLKAPENDGDDSHWFFAGTDDQPGTLGVFRSHGEDPSCWTNRMYETPSTLNKLADGTFQAIDPGWFLQPNGTNVWIYASVLGDHIRQSIGSNTNKSAVVIIRKGDSTNIIYETDSWYQIGEVKTNGVVIAEARGRGSRRDTPAHKWTLELKNVEETVTVTADEERSADIADAGLESNDPYYNAIMHWLSLKGDDASGIHRARQWDVGGRDIGGAGLDIKDMYWLNIDPTEPGWVLQAGMGRLSPADRFEPAAEGASLAAAAPVVPRVSAPVVEPVVVSAERDGASLLAVTPPSPVDGLGPVWSYTNVRMTVSMKIMNTNDAPWSARAHAPDRIQGLEPGSTSYSPESGYEYDGGANWTSATFKVCGALQKDGVRDRYYPLRWFVFGPDSFDEDFSARIEIDDPHSTSSPGYFNGWSAYRGTPIFYKWRLDADPAFYDTVEMLNSNSTYQATSP